MNGRPLVATTGKTGAKLCALFGAFIREAQLAAMALKKWFSGNRKAPGTSRNWERCYLWSPVVVVLECELWPGGGWTWPGREKRASDSRTEAGSWRPGKQELSGHERRRLVTRGQDCLKPLQHHEQQGLRVQDKGRTGRGLMTGDPILHFIAHSGVGGCCRRIGGSRGSPRWRLHVQK